MTATPQDYAVGGSMATKILQADINTEIPGWARGMIPAGLAGQVGPAIAKAVIDAVDEARAKRGLILVQGGK